MSNSLIARRHLFSTAHFYEQKQFTPEKNREVFGACYTPAGHGHNYVLEVFVEGPVDVVTGLVMNVTDLDVVMKAATAKLDHHHINFDVPEFKNVVPTTENIARYLYPILETGLRSSAPNLKINRIRLFETDDIWAEARKQKPTSGSSIQVTREVLVRGIHHLENSSMTPEENKSLYGICYGRHGHHYKIQVTCRGSIEEKSGTVVARDYLEEILQKHIVGPYDGVELNRKFPNTSCEALAKEFFDILERELPQGSLVRVGVQETRKNYFEFPPEG